MNNKRVFSQTHHLLALKLLDLKKIIEIANAELVSSYKDTYTFNLTVYFNPEYLKKANLFQGTKLSQEQYELISQLNLV